MCAFLLPSWVWMCHRYFQYFPASVPGLIWILRFFPCALYPPISPSCLPLRWMNFLNFSCYILWTCYFWFSEKHIHWKWEVKQYRASAAPGHSPHSHHCLASCNSGYVLVSRFTAKKKKEKRAWRHGKISQPDQLGFWGNFLSSPWRDKNFSFTGPFEARQLWGGIHKCHNRECSENLNFQLWKVEIYCWPLPCLAGILREHWVLQIGTEGIYWLNSINRKKINLQNLPYVYSWLFSQNKNNYFHLFI